MGWRRRIILVRLYSFAAKTYSKYSKFLSMYIPILLISSSNLYTSLLSVYSKRWLSFLKCFLRSLLFCLKIGEMLRGRPIRKILSYFCMILKAVTSRIYNTLISLLRVLKWMSSDWPKRKDKQKKHLL